MGQCPAESDPIVNSVHATCVDMCQGHDFMCPGTQKCCGHHCGGTCQPASGLEDVGEDVLPKVPHDVRTNSTIIDSKTAELSWNMSCGALARFDFEFVVEARSHPGYKFTEHRLGQWFKIGFEMTAEQETKLPFSRGKQIE